jgi:hypothetical protein
MLGNPHSNVDSAKRTDPRSFLSSHRALAVRLREFDRLTDAVISDVTALGASATGPLLKPVVRRSPNRCLVQFGPVALTLTWLRHTNDSAAAGELLVVVWRGIIATADVHAADRTTTLVTPVRSATVVWEEVLQAVAIDEPSWLWQPAGADIGGYRSTELAERCVEQLRLAVPVPANA